ncbi:MAG: response regulator [Candidatus Rokubacteria bacterium]|nr:response regulator [Candidatus Rokubacteria bacterium]
MKGRILAVEDSPTQAEHLRHVLEEGGYEVIVAANGAQALSEAHRHPPIAVVSDIVMPGMDGYALCRRLKADAELKDVPVILATELSGPHDIVRALECGADSVIPKPYDERSLLSRLSYVQVSRELSKNERTQMGVEIDVAGQRHFISAERRQILDLLISTYEEAVHLNEELSARQREVERFIARDASETKRVQEALRQSEKLAAMSEMLAGVAHELNNPLTVIVGQTLLLRRAVEGGALAVRAGKIGLAAERCSRIVRNFLAFAREYPPEHQEVALDQIVREAVELLAYQLRVDNVEVVLNLAGDLPTLWADPHQLHHVVVNLVTNAHQATREVATPRTLTLVTRADPARGRVFLEVSDTGPGIPSEIQRRIFEPFFTTKPPGQGTGLGLSLCQGIVENHGGSIGVESRPGHGATFLVELPVRVRPAGALHGPPAEILLPTPGKAILVVDDEPEVAGVLAEMLAADGHRVTTAADGALALDALRRGAYDVILSDVRMPALDGPGLYRELERQHPQLLRRFVFVTGDTLSAETRDLLDRAGAPSLSKPFDAEEIRRVIKRITRAG